MTESSFVIHAIDLLAPLGPMHARAMMGGHLLYRDDLAVALVYEDRLYLKTDPLTRDNFGRAGGKPFTYERRGRQVEMSFWMPPESALDHSESMFPWARLALAAARRAKRSGHDRGVSVGRAARLGRGRKTRRAPARRSAP
jgi:DNA transformation protein